MKFFKVGDNVTITLSDNFSSFNGTESFSQILGIVTEITHHPGIPGNEEWDGIKPFTIVKVDLFEKYFLKNSPSKMNAPSQRIREKALLPISEIKYNLYNPTSSHLYLQPVSIELA